MQVLNPELNHAVNPELNNTFNPELNNTFNQAEAFSKYHNNIQNCIHE